MKSQPQSQWTLDSVVTYMDARLHGIEHAASLALDAQEKMTERLDTATEHRLEGLNDFRHAMTDQIRTFMPRAEYTAGHDALEKRIEQVGAANSDKINSLQLTINAMTGRAQGLSMGFQYLLAIHGALMTLIAIGLTVVIIVFK